MEELTLLGERAVQAKYELQRMTTEKKNEVLEAVAGGINPKTRSIFFWKITRIWSVELQIR